MLRGLYTAAAGMITQQRRHDIITNNISNLNTPGFKSQSAVARSFPEMLIRLTGGGEGAGSSQDRAIGRIHLGVMVEEVLPIFMQGDLQETENPSDFALLSNIRLTEMVNGAQVEIAFDASGRGTTQAGEAVYQPQAFFAVVNDAGEERYTRNGKFYVDPDGTVRTTDGLRVLGEDGQPIVVDRSLDLINVTGSGAFLDEENRVLARLRIARIDDPFQLVREGSGYFRLDNPDGAVPTQLTDRAMFSVKQGFIERSNVDPTQSVADMMTALRTYEANQRVIQYYDRSLDKAVNEIGRV